MDKNPATNRSLSPVPARTPAAMPLPCRSTGRCSARPSTSVIWRPSPPLSTTPAEHQWRSESGLILSISNVEHADTPTAATSRWSPSTATVAPSKSLPCNRKTRSPSNDSTPRSDAAKPSANISRSPRNNWRWSPSGPSVTKCKNIFRESTCGMNFRWCLRCHTRRSCWESAVPPLTGWSPPVDASDLVAQRLASAAEHGTGPSPIAADCPGMPGRALQR